MTWNYRILKRKCKETGEIYYALIEVFYSDEGFLKAYIEHDEVVGDSPEEVVKVLEMMLADAKKDQPILTEEDFGNES